jgi:pimeloyl-ACP methyl ester carboxylesterase
MKLIEDGVRHHVLTGRIALDCPIRLLHGQADPDVPWELALTIAQQAASADVEVTLVKDGDHRLSRAGDLALLRRTVGALLDGG